MKIQSRACRMWHNIRLFVDFAVSHQMIWHIGRRLWCCWTPRSGPRSPIHVTKSRSWGGRSVNQRGSRSCPAGNPLLQSPPSTVSPSKALYESQGKKHLLCCSYIFFRQSLWTRQGIDRNHRLPFRCEPLSLVELLEPPVPHLKCTLCHTGRCPESRSKDSAE